MSPSELASIVKYPELRKDDFSSYKLIYTGGGALQKFVIDQIAVSCGYISYSAIDFLCTFVYSNGLFN